MDHTPPRGPQKIPPAGEQQKIFTEKPQVPSGGETQGVQKSALKSEETHHSCRCISPRGRNLVVCIDGTSNQFGEKNTNIVELYSRLVKSKDQLTYYNSGIGTYVKDSKSFKALRQSVYHTLDKAFAINFKAKVLSAYHWLSENYEPGDRIFLFGFSRGAYQVRVIAGMIEKVGLLHKGNKEQITFAYDLYTQTIERGEKATKKQKKDRQQSSELCRRFKQTLSRRDVTVHFVGSWDTVSAIGIIKGPSLPETTNGMRHVCTFRHALALDELRVKFLPEYAYGGAGPSELVDSDKSNDTVRPKGDIKEVWFAGSHSDIGGGNIANLSLDHFGPSLRWMSYEAIKQGLKMEPHRSPWESLIPRSSMHWFYRIMEYLPISRLSYTGPHHIIRWPPNLLRPRQIKPGQLIHESVFDNALTVRKYKPLAELYGEITWDVNFLRDKKIVEVDPYSKAGYVLQALEKSLKESNSRRQYYDALATVSSSPFGKQSIVEFPGSGLILTNALEAECGNSSNDDGHIAIETLIDVLDSFELIPQTSQRSPASATLWPNLDKLLRNQSTQLPERWYKFYDCYGPVPMNPSALVIGIDTYQNDDLAVDPRHGSIKGARDIAKLLMATMGLPYDEISMLLNERATRAKILESIRSLATNNRVLANDPIFIFFAGRSIVSKQDTTSILPYDHLTSWETTTSVDLNNTQESALVLYNQNIHQQANATSTDPTSIARSGSKGDPNPENNRKNSNLAGAVPDANVICPISADDIEESLAEVPVEKRGNITFILDCLNAELFKGNFRTAGFSSKALISAFKKHQATGVESSRASFGKILTNILDDSNKQKHFPIRGYSAITYRDLLEGPA